MGALGRGAEPGAPAGDPRIGASRPLCAIQLHRADKYKLVCYFFKNIQLFELQANR